MRLVRLVAVLGLVALGACDKKNAAGPSQLAAATTGLAISGPDAVLTSLSATYAVTATLSDGTTRTITPAWTSSNPAVGSVDNGGRLEARTHGSTNLMASYEGRSTSKMVQVVNNYGGTWEGRYVIRACSDSGDLTNHDGGWCLAGSGRVGNVYGVRMTLAQSGTTLTEITGSYGSFEETITGVVTADGRLSLGGRFSEWDWEHELILATWQIRAWDSNLGGPGVMTGRWSEHLVSLYFRIGTADLENEIVTMTRVSTSVTAASTSR